MLLGMPSVQDLLHSLPNLPLYQRLVNSLIPSATIIEIGRVNPFAQDLVQGRHRDLALALPETESFLVRFLRPVPSENTSPSRTTRRAS
jgi:hypothetical protein